MGRTKSQTSSSKFADIFGGLRRMRYSKEVLLSVMEKSSHIKGWLGFRTKQKAHGKRIHELHYVSLGPGHHLHQQSKHKQSRKKNQIQALQLAARTKHAAWVDSHASRIKEARIERKRMLSERRKKAALDPVFYMSRIMKHDRHVGLIPEFSD